MLLFVLISIVTVLCLLHLLLNHNESARIMKRIPGPSDVFLVGNALHIPTSPVELFRIGRVFAQTFNGIYRFWSYPFYAVNIYNPEDIEKVLSTTRYNEKSEIYKFLRPWLKEGLLVSRGTKWHQRRKVLTPAFHFNILRHFSDVLEENSHRLTEQMSQNSDPFTVDVIPLISEYTLQSICETAMGTRLNEETTGAGRSYKKSIYKLGKILVERFAKLYLFFDVLFDNTKTGKTQKIHLEKVHDFTRKVINDRKEYIDKHGVIAINDITSGDETLYATTKNRKLAMLDLLLAAQKEGMIDDDGVQEEVDTFMFEGHDTTAAGLIFFLMVLANEKDIQDKVVAEINEVFGDSSRMATIDDLSKLKYLECCIKESMRLYPPVPFISRSLDENIQLSNYTVVAGAFCHIHIYDLHRRADLYEDPAVFNPDRFLPENCIGRHPYAYIPFSAGPRNCIGQKFAMLEMKSLITTILRKFELYPVTRISDIEISADLVLRTTHPIYVTFSKRNRN